MACKVGSDMRCIHSHEVHLPAGDVCYVQDVCYPAERVPQTLHGRNPEVYLGSVLLACKYKEELLVQVQYLLTCMRCRCCCRVQLAGRGVIDDVFALCFGSVEGDGALMLGDVSLQVRVIIFLPCLPRACTSDSLLACLQSATVLLQTLVLEAAPDNGTRATKLCPMELVRVFMTSILRRCSLHAASADAPQDQDVALQYTPLLASLAHPHYYSVRLEALWVGTTQLPVAQVRWAMPVHMDVPGRTWSRALPIEAQIM